MAFASSASSTNSCGLTQRSTGWCRGVGRRYCVIVTRSQPASFMSRSACEISSRVSPIPRIRFDFVTMPAARPWLITSSDRSYRNAGRIDLKIRGTVSRLCANTSGLASKT
jgi:hypothetical protein